MLFLDGAQKRMIDTVVAEAWSRVPSATGVISTIDAKFLLGVIAGADAHRVIEVGVAAGSSSTAILSLFDALGGDRALYGFDLLETFYGDPTKPLGFIAREDPVASKQHYHVFGGALAADIGAKLDLASISGLVADVAFIDAHHCHPWATLDTLCVLPFVRSDGWIVLHDTNLTKLAGHGAEFGPRVLFDTFAGEKMEADLEIPNIGALKLSGRTEEIGSIVEALDVAWEFVPEFRFLERIHQRVTSFLTGANRMRFEQIMASRAGFQRVTA